MKQIFFIALFLLTSCEENQSIENIKDPNVYSIGFGSCLTQERSMPIFNSIKAEDYDLFLMLIPTLICMEIQNEKIYLN